MNYLFENENPKPTEPIKPKNEEITPENKDIDLENKGKTPKSVQKPKNPIEAEKNVNTYENDNVSHSQEAHNYFTTPREKKSETPPKEEPVNEDEEKDEETNSFNLTQEECTLIGEFIAETGDVAIPQIAAYLNEEKDVKQYEAGERNIKAIANAWGRYLYQKQLDISPAQQILLATGIAYALPLAGGIKHRMPHIMTFIKKMIASLMGRESSSQHKNTAAAPEIYKAKPINRDKPTIQVVPITQEREPNEVEIRVCKKADCNETFKTGLGFAKGKNAKNYDSFCSISCMSKHTGSQSRGNKK